MPIDPMLPLQVDNSTLPGPFELLPRIQELRHRQNQNLLFQQENDARVGVGEAYRKALGPDGEINNRALLEAFARETIVLPFNDADALKDAFETNDNKIACVILEPCPGNMGVVPALPGYLAKVRELCTQHGAVLIFDEVMSGFRVGISGVQGLEHITPDLTTLGKIIGGGLPVGAFGGKREIMDHLAPLGPVYQAGTLSGNPLAMAAGLASLRLLQANPPYERLERASAEIAGALLNAAKAKGIPLVVNRSGSMFSLFFSECPVINFETATSSEGARFRRVFHHALENGVYLPPSPYETCFISTAHDHAAVARTAEVLAGAIASL